MDLELEGKAALVTGGSGGIGRAAAAALSAEGARVAIAARGRKGLEEAAAEIEARTGRAPRILSADCSRPEEAARMAAEAAEALGGLHFLVNMASDFQRVPFAQL
ncbi:MAG: SDR family NAD(P)-dependent oxidoreductase, partial [bacterium]